jgi:hypothetical protein
MPPLELPARAVRIESALIGLALGLSACGGIPVVTSSTVELGPTVKVPASWVRPVDQCMHDAGLIAVAVHEGVSGTNERYGYSWQGTTYFTWEAPSGANQAAAGACGNRFAPNQPKSDEEIRAIYDRWSLERRCLIDLGYQPDEPPSSGEFLRTWRTTGPWMPVDGISNPSAAARETCGLEML